MSAPTPTLEVGTAARTTQLAIRARLMADVARIWPLLDRKHLPETFPGWLEAMKAVTRAYRRESSTAAGIHYRQAREIATLSPAPESLIKPANDPADAWLEKAYRYSGPGMLSRDTARPNTALTTTLGTAARIVQDGGQATTIETVLADPVAVGWYRETGPSPCYFCALMASRGIAYKVERQADFKAHNHCACTAQPAFSHDQELPELGRTAAEVYRNRGKGPAMQAFRKAWDEHQSPS